MSGWYEWERGRLTWDGEFLILFSLPHHSGCRTEWNASVKERERQRSKNDDERWLLFSLTVVDNWWCLRLFNFPFYSLASMFVCADKWEGEKLSRTTWLIVSTYYSSYRLQWLSRSENNSGVRFHSTSNAASSFLFAFPYVLHIECEEWENLKFWSLHWLRLENNQSVSLFYTFHSWVYQTGRQTEDSIEEIQKKDEVNEEWGIDWRKECVTEFRFTTFCGKNIPFNFLKK